MLPFLEQKPIFDAFNFDLDPDIALANSTGATMFIAAFLCPSDGRVTRAQKDFAMHNDLLNVGSRYCVVQAPAAPLTGLPDGVFDEDASLSPPASATA